MIELSLNSKNYTFKKVPLNFLATQIQDVFAKKNNRKLRETLKHRRYQNFGEYAFQHYAAQLDKPLGEFLYELKSRSDSFYLRFLNAYGDRTYCTFNITQEDQLTQKGLYIYTVNDQLKYIGRCRDSFRKRVNQGYGKIHPKNCYVDGQSTNCHLNALIAEENPESVAFYVHSLTDDEEIITTERGLIQKYKPAWNIALKPLKLQPPMK